MRFRRDHTGAVAAPVTTTHAQPDETHAEETHDEPHGRGGHGDEAHGHGGHGDEAALGPIDWLAWEAALVGIVAALAVAGAWYLSANPL